MAELMNEQAGGQEFIEREYAARFKTLLADTARELEKRKKLAKGTQVLTPAKSAAIEQQATLDFIESKKINIALLNLRYTGFMVRVLIF